jgi:class 3 adenylate cyclase/tetratricopeptide (TPR) repeat protein
VSTSISDWLKTNDLEAYLPIFLENQIDLKTLEVLTESDLNELGLPFGPRKRILRAIAELKRQASFPHGAVETPVAAASLGERRQLTVMFCDLVGSTALSTLLDPEELRELIQTYRKACDGVVSRYDGNVAQYLGDGLMIYFGWPIAHEDDAERGVRSALEMVQAVKSIRAERPLAIRIGLATGPVVVGEASRDDKAEAGLAVGETPNLAARLQAQAGSDEVFIAARTRRLVGDVFALTDLGAHLFKGISEPVRVWRVDEVRRTEGRFKAAHSGMELAPLVGRDEENTLLGRRWEQARSGEGQIVLISGQPGIGKSRLVQELRESITEAHTALHYQCSPYHLNSPLHPFIEQFEISADFGHDDAPEQRLEKLEAALVGSTAQMAESAPLFAALLSLPAERYPLLHLSPRKQKEKTLEALAGRIEAMARQAPVLMVVEDVHWIDPTSQELLELLAPKVLGLPVLLVMTYRLEYAPSWAGQPGVTALTLNRLDRHQGAQLVDVVTEGKALPPEVLNEILARTDGVPLFVEELTKSLLESGRLREDGDHYALQGSLAALAIPESLRDSLMARLDRLGPVKELAQIGACIGREFSFELLERISTQRVDSLEASLETLVAAGLVTRRDPPPDATYIFKHALVQDAAYESLLKSRRSELHAKIAQVLENDFADRVTNAPEWLAHHRTQAGHFAQAIPLWRRAGTLAVGRVALKEAVAHFQKGLMLIDQLSPSRERDSLELTIREPLNAAWTGLRGWAAPEVVVNAAAILRLAESQGKAQSLLLAMWWVWTSTITQGRIADSLACVDRLLAEGGQDEDIDMRMFGHAAAMVQSFLSGHLVKSRQQTDLALAMYEPQRAERWIQLTGHDLRTFVEVYACQLMWMLGFPDQARRLSDECMAHAHADGHAFNLVWALTFSAYVFAYRREPERFLGRVGEADRLAREQGLAFIYEVSVPQALGLAELQNGRPREAISLLRQGIERWTKTGGNVRVPFVKSALAQAVALVGDPGAALELIDECLEQIERPAGQERLWLAEVLRLKGWILMRQGRDTEAETQLRASIECARRQHAKSWELRSSTTLATLMARRGQRAAARDLLSPIYGWFTEGADTKDLIEARVLLERLIDGRTDSCQHET